MTHPQTNSSFSKSQPNLQTAWDSTSLGLLKTCPKKYYYSMIENWATKDASVHLSFGIWYHSALETFDKVKMEGASHDTATIIAVRHILIASKGFIGEGPKTRETLVRSIVWYIEHFKDDPTQVIRLENGRPAVELSFRMDLPLTSPDGEPYLLCGHLDKAVEWQGQIYILDRKTTKSALGSYYFDKFSPDNQMSAYSAAGKVVLQKDAVGIIIDAVQLGVNFARFGRGMVYRTKAQLDEWLADTLYWIKQAEGYAATSHWPMNDLSCDKYGGCPFRGVCNKDVSVRETFLKADFIKRVWDPLSIRE